jgi:hypothetical protein
MEVMSILTGGGLDFADRFDRPGTSSSEVESESESLISASLLHLGGFASLARG